MILDEHTQQLYQQVILDHNKSPQNYRKLAGYTHSSEGYNPLCGDHIWVYVLIKEDGTIAEISFEGQSCAICKASASLMTVCMRGMRTAEAKRKTELFQKLLQGEKITKDELGKLLVFSTIWRYPARVKCAALAWHTLRGAIENEYRVSTEA